MNLLVFKGKTPTCIDLILTNQKQLFSWSQKLLLLEFLTFMHWLPLLWNKLILKVIQKLNFTEITSNLNKDHFDIDLKQNFRSLPNLTYKDFEDTFLRTLDKHAPIKKKILRANENAFMNKTLRKAIMIRSNLKNIYLKKRNYTNWTNYKNNVTSAQIYCAILKKTIFQI